MINYRHPQYETLDEEQIQAINLMHISREAMLTAANNDVNSAKAIYPSWVALETALQRLWGFTEDISYVKFWHYPHCTCPKIDNDDLYPSGLYVFNNSCPIHGTVVETNDSKELKDIIAKALEKSKKGTTKEELF